MREHPLDPAREAAREAAVEQGLALRQVDRRAIAGRQQPVDLVDGLAPEDAAE